VEKCGKAEQATDGNITRRMRCAVWVTKATDTLRMFNTVAFPRQQWLCERASALRLYVHCLSCFFLFILRQFFSQPMFQLKISQFKGTNVSFYCFPARGSRDILLLQRHQGRS
jgi:hypothetical protein